MDVEVVNS
jgi:hypothetical protein